MARRDSDVLIALKRQTSRWRWAAIAAGLAATIVTTGAAYFLATRFAGQRYAAIVNQTGQQPALMVMVDTAAKTVLVYTLGVEKPKDRSLELWYIAKGESPRSFGLLSPDASREVGFGRLPYNPADRPVVFAVSSEPPGGSPTGQPTGPVLYTGQLIELK